MLTFIIDSLRNATLMDLMRGFEQERFIVPVMDLTSQAAKLGTEVVDLGIKIVDNIVVLL